MNEEVFTKLGEIATMCAYIQQTLNKKYRGRRNIYMEIKFGKRVDIEIFDFQQSHLVSSEEFPLSEFGIKRCGDYVTGIAMMEGVI